MGRDADDFIRTTLRHFATLRKNPDSAVGTAFPKGWFDLPDALWADLGAMFYLTALTGFHRGRSLADALTMLEPPLRLGQYRVFRTPDGQPRAFVSWAGLSAAAERWFAVEHMPLRPEDWNSGPSKWLIGFVAPFGHIDEIVPALTANRNETRVRTLWHNKTGSRYRVVEWSRPKGEEVVSVRSYGAGQFARQLEVEG